MRRMQFPLRANSGHSGEVDRPHQKDGRVGFETEVSVSCECTNAEPNKPDCKAKSKKSIDGTITVQCVKSGGCQTCKQMVTTTSSGVIMGLG